MKNTALREKWQETIRTIDYDFLEMIDQLYNDFNTKTESDFYTDLPNEIKEILHLSKQQIKKGQTSTHDEVMDEVNKRFNLNL